jgi:aspartate carbamoyltransferase catalytic subunit
MKKLSDISWDDFEGLSLAEKGAYYAPGDVLEHVIIAQQFRRERLDSLGRLATRIRRIAKSHAGMDFLQGVLSHKRAMLYFSQPSTRTFLSFCAACEILGIKMGEVRDTSTSSEFKGESQEDSVRTFSSYFDLIIMRSKIGGLAERMAWMLSNSERPVPVINAGSGKDQHPTQAVLDIYTLQRSFEKIGGIDGKRIVFVGDLLRGRTVRSLSFLLTQYRDVEQVFVAPDHLQVGEDIQQMLTACGVKFALTSDLASELAEADAIYMTRLQDEWDDKDGGTKIDISRFGLTAAELEVMKSTAVIMHPLPRRMEIAPEVDRDPRAVYWRQMRNGMWVRAAIIVTMFEEHETINQYFDKYLADDGRHD